MGQAFGYSEVQGGKGRRACISLRPMTLGLPPLLALKVLQKPCMSLANQPNWPFTPFTPITSA
jgi:hypothetical protein